MPEDRTNYKALPALPTIPKPPVLVTVRLLSGQDPIRFVVRPPDLPYVPHVTPRVRDELRYRHLTLDGDLELAGLDLDGPAPWVEYTAKAVDMDPFEGLVGRAG